MRIRNRFLTRLLAWLAVRLMRVLFATCRRKDFTEVPGMNPYDGDDIDRHLYCVWHDQVVMVMFAGRAEGFAGLVSRHHDGTILSDAMEMLRIKPIRGSSSRGGAQALKELMETAKDRHVVITPDGPRGPRHELKAGIVYLASQSGRKIVPVAMTCKRTWNIRGNWTDMMLPKPFTTIYAVGLQPLKVPPGLDRDGIDRFTALLQDEMLRAERLVNDAAAGWTPDFAAERGEQKLAA